MHIINRYYSKLKSFFLTKDVLSFLIFLLLAFAFWFINMLDKERTTELSVPLRYSGMPQQFDITKSNVKLIKIAVKDKGVNLFAYSDEKLKSLTIELNGKFYERGKIVLSNDEIRTRLLKYLLPTTSVLEIKPDSLVLVYERLASKVVPVMLNSKIETAQQYILSDDVLIEPATITVYGPQRLLKNLQHIKTEFVEIRNLDENRVLTTKLVKPDGIRLSTEDVKLSVFAEMFTEKTMTFPVKVINCPANLIVRTFPSQVDVKFNVGLTHFKKVSVSDIDLFINFNDIVKNNAGKQRIQLTNKAGYISNPRIENNEIEYIIERK